MELSPLAYFIIIFVVIMGVVTLDQIPLIDTILVQSAIDAEEFYSGIILIVVVMVTMIFVLSKIRW